MKRIITRSVTAIILLLSAVIGILSLNSRFGFLPQEITAAVDDFCYEFFSKEDEIGELDTSDYVMLSSLSDSPLLELVDLSVPNDTCIPTSNEIAQVYRGLYAADSSLVAAFTNYDIIVQKYEVAKDSEPEDFKNSALAAFEAKHPEVTFDADRTISTNGVKAPTIEFSLENDGETIYSYIGFIKSRDAILTVSVNSVDTLFDSSRFFSALLTNMIIT